MKSKTPALMLTLLVVCSGPWATPTGAQAPSTTVDVAVTEVWFLREPVVNNTGTILFARINATDQSVADVVFTWGDGTPLVTGNLPGNTDSTRVAEFTQGGPESKTVNVAFTPPFGRRGEQEIKVVATVRAKQDTNLTNNTVVIKTIVRFPKLNLTFEQPPAVDVVPEGETFVRYFVRNDGNYPDNATAVLEVDPGNPWRVDHYGPLPVVPPGQSVTGVVVVRPNATTAPANLSLNVSIRSGIGPEGDVRAQAPQLHVNETMYARVPALAIDPLPTNVQVFPSEERALHFTVRNTGDIEQIVRVSPSIVGAPPGWNASMRVPSTWPANLTAPVDVNYTYPVPLRPNESFVLQVNLTRAAVTPNLTATLRLEANSTVGDLLGARVGGSYRAVATALLSDAGPDLTANFTGAVGTIYQGDTPSFRIAVRNPGRSNATNASLHLEMRDNLRTVEEIDLPVPPIPAGSGTVLTWSPSTAGLRGPYVLLGRIDVNASQQDRNPENNTFRLDLHVRAPFLKVRAPESVTIIPGSRLAITSATGGFSVENTGDREEAIVATLESPQEWLRAEWRTLVPPGATMPLPLTLDVPDFPGAKSVAATFTARVDARPHYSASAQLAFEVDDVEPPRVTVLSPTAPTFVGNQTRIAVRAEDASGIRRAEVILQSPTGERTALPLQRDASDPGVYATRHTPAFVGAYVMEFRIEDASLQGRTTVLGNVTWIVEAPRYAGLRPVNFGEGAHVGAAPLRLAEVVNGTTATVLVDLGTGFRPLARPYEIRLPSAEGPRTLAVRATSQEGILWEGRWNVTVDLTPPSVQDPVSKDAGDGRVDLAVRAEGAKEVRARFETDTGPVEVDLGRRSGGLFGATVTPPASWTSVTFLAKDEAGNVGSASLDASNRDAPAPALALVLLALAALALARRRRG